MDTEGQIIIDKKSKELRRKNIIEIAELIVNNYDNHNKKLYFFIFILLLINFGIVNYIFIYKKEQKDKAIGKKIKNINNNAYMESEELPEISYEKFDENIFQEVKKQQMKFCNEQNKYKKFQFEKQIKLANASFLNKSFDMYIYENQDLVSKIIRFGQSWESTETRNLIKALNYYSSLKNISNDNIYIIDIGANVGWYTLFLAKIGYQVLSFEASVVNIYILRKNLCLNPDLNITLINKGLFTEEKKCDYYLNSGNIGNGMIQCNKNGTVSFEFTKSSEAYLTKLSNYVEFLSFKNLALIKIDNEGSEGKAIESGIELKYFK